MGKRLKPRSRSRTATFPNTAERKIVIERARQFLRANLPPATVEEMLPLEPLVWSTRLPGWKEAAQSAIEALYTYAAETIFWRSLALATSDQHRAEVLARFELEAELRSPSTILRELSDSVRVETRAEAEYRVLQQVSWPAKRFKPLPLLVDLEQLKTGVHGTPANPDEALVVSAMQGKSSPARRMLIWAWTTGGLWLADNQAIHIWFATLKRNRPGFRSLGAPSAETVRVWKSELGLQGYLGEGKLEFSKDGLPHADANLRREVEAALSSR